VPSVFNFNYVWPVLTDSKMAKERTWKGEKEKYMKRRRGSGRKRRMRVKKRKCRETGYRYE
jgi:hypothetical protein